jgi:glycosyltransferase involved in cell wall biosynthesis
MRDLFAASRVVVLPSRSEGLPRVLLEAQAMETPVVAYRCGGMSDALLPSQSGFLLEAGDVQGLADRIALLLDDQKMRVRFGQIGREFVVRHFSIDALVTRHEAFYRGALSSFVRQDFPGPTVPMLVH